MKRRIILPVILAGIVVMCGACGNANMKHGSGSASEEASVSAEAESTGPQVTQILISGAGDVTLGSDVSQPTDLNFDTMYEEVSDPAYFLKGVSSVFDADDMTLVNLEGTLSEQGERQDKTYAFRGDPAYVDILKEGSVEAVAFANNHCQDYGEISYTDTMKYLDEAGIVYSSFDIVGIYETKGKKIGMVSVSELRGYDQASELITQGIEKLRENDADAVIVSIHGGIEHEYSVDDEMKRIAHFAVDEGADLVLCHHPHVLQGVEKYNNVYIAYSLGNFCFGGNTNPSDKDTMIFQKTFTFVDDALVLDDAVKAIPCSVSSTSSRNDYQPTIKEGEAFTDGIETLNDYSEEFNVVFADDGSIESANGAAGFVPDAATALTAETRAKGAAAGASTGTVTDSSADASAGTDSAGDADTTGTAGTNASDTADTDTAAETGTTESDSALTDGTVNAAAGTDTTAGSDSAAGATSGTTGTTGTSGTASGTTGAGSTSGAATGTTGAGNASGTAGSTTDSGTANGTTGTDAGDGNSDSPKKGLMRHRDLLQSDEKIFALQ